jgi:uncharacterized protein (TIGR03067 family)
MTRPSLTPALAACAVLCLVLVGHARGAEAKPTTTPTTTPPTTKPATTKPAMTKPAMTKPATTKPATTKPATKPDAAKADREALQGSWKLVSVEADGKADDQPDGSVLKFDGDEVFEVKAGEKKDPAAYRVDPVKDPKQFDLIPQTGGDKGATIQAIYEIKGDTLRLALGDKSHRPAAFKSGDGVVVLTLKRQKA